MLVKGAIEDWIDVYIFVMIEKIYVSDLELCYGFIWLYVTVCV